MIIDAEISESPQGESANGNTSGANIYPGGRLDHRHPLGCPHLRRRAHVQAW